MMMMIDVCRDEPATGDRCTHTKCVGSLQSRALRADGRRATRTGAANVQCQWLRHPTLQHAVASRQR